MEQIKNSAKKTAYLGLSGGVDSAVSAKLLLNAGYNVVAVFIKTWAPAGYPCPMEADRREAFKVAAHLRIPCIEVDGEDVYKKYVAEIMIDDYKNGRTPNPDVLCNEEVKFGVFYNFAMSRGADYIATGHYAKIVANPPLTKGRVDASASGGVLFKGSDPSKDQSYFLWKVPFEKLQKTLFPIGDLPKSEVRKLAQKFKLPNANRPDSQGVCFLGPIDMKEFIKETLCPAKGQVLNARGEVIGEHDGAILYTIGERHGFRVNVHEDESVPLYVISKNVNDNTITVGKEEMLYASPNTQQQLYIKNTNWLGREPEENKTYDAMLRYHGELFPVRLQSCRSNASAQYKVEFVSKSRLIASGQSVVIYSGDLCLGGGIAEYR